LGTHATALATALGRLGIGSGDAVAVQLTNRAKCVVAYQAVLLCGAVLVPIVHIYGAAEVGFILADSGAKALITAERFGSTRSAERLTYYHGIDTLRAVILVDAEPGHQYFAWSQMFDDPKTYARPAVHADDVCLLLYTSGTTSAPKGVQHTHNTILSELETQRTLIAGRTDDVSLVTFPPGHIAGVTGMLRPAMHGTTPVFMDTWDAAAAVELIARFGVTSTAGAPIHLDGILSVPGAAEKLTTLREFLVGAAPVSEELGRRAWAAGIEAFRCYGSTEHPTVTGDRRGEPRSAQLSTEGKTLPGSSVRIGTGDGRDSGVGTEGEVLVQGPDQFIGYRNRALNSDVFTADGWFRTGDLGVLDDCGRLTITGRIKEVIIPGGETISSRQVEDVLNTHPAVAEGVIVAAADPRYGEVVAAVVVLQIGATLDLEFLREHYAASGLARQKTPERLLILDGLPRTALGKVKKDELRRQYFS
jgi:acyl-coenzyme A synthetase/AMP-(fatty) acid ligase